MTAQLLDGKTVAQTIKDELKASIVDKPAPGLAVVLAGNDPASEVYVQHKQKACDYVGIHSELHHLDAKVSQEDLIALIDKLNADKNIHGILVQLPLPNHIDTQQIIERISPTKDVDGFHPYNLGRLAQRRPALRPCTPYGVITLLEKSGINVAGMDATVVGASNIVGRPMVLELLLAKATVTNCHRFTKDLKKHIQNADLLVSATGHSDVIQSAWIKPGAVVIDIGITRLPNGKLTGDIDFETAKERAGYITPVPGGVGPMTVAMLLQNTYQSFSC